MGMFSQDFEEQQAKLFKEWLEEFGTELLKRQNPLHDLLTRKKIKERLDISNGTLDKYIMQGLPVHTVPNSRQQYFLESEVYRFLGIKKAPTLKALRTI